MAASTSPICPPESAPGPGAALGSPDRPPARSRILFGADALAALDALDTLDSLDPARNPHLGYWDWILRHGTRAVAENLRARPGLLVHGRQHWPLAVTEPVPDNSYPCSLFTQYVAYPQAELGLVPSPATRLLARLGLAVLGRVLALLHIDRTVQWNAWLLSTNLHDPATTTATAHAIPAVTRALASAFPRRAIVVRNLTRRADGPLPDAFRQAGYRLVTSRQVYFFDGTAADLLRNPTVRRELRAFARPGGPRTLGPGDFHASDAPRIHDLYRQLYVEKHSRLNPRYTPAFVEQALRHGWLEFHGLRSDSGSIDGVFGLFTRGQTTSCPFVGYDLSQPADLGLYRRLVTLLLSRVSERRQLLNYSSGAGEFKRRRGGEPAIEFNALYVGHLPAAARSAFHLLETLANRLAQPFLEHAGL